MAASAYPRAPKVTLSGRAPSARRTRGSGLQLSGPGGTTSSCRWVVKTGSCQTIQSDRGPVSPSGMRRTRSPISAAMARKTASGLASGTLPTRCAPDATGWATAVMSMTEWARASAQTRTGSREWVRAGHPASQIGESDGSRPRFTASPGPLGPRTGVTYAHDNRARVREMGEALKQQMASSDRRRVASWIGSADLMPA